MDEAARILPPQPSAVIVTLARQAVIKAVKEQLRRQGLKPAYMTKRDIVRLAKDYLVEHRHACSHRHGSAFAQPRSCGSFMTESSASANGCLAAEQSSRKAFNPFRRVGRWP